MHALIQDKDLFGFNKNGFLRLLVEGIPWILGGAKPRVRTRTKKRVLKTKECSQEAQGIVAFLGWKVVLLLYLEIG